MIDHLQITALQIGNATAGGSTCTDSAAVSGQTANALFLMDGQQIAQQQRPVELLFAAAQFFGIFYYRQRHGHALIAAAGIHHHGQLTATHPGIRPGSSGGLCSLLDVISVGGQNHAANVGAPGVLQPLMRNGAVVFDLTANDGGNVRKVGSGGKIVDTLHSQRILRRSLPLLRSQRIVHQNFPILLHQNNIGVGMGDTNLCVFLPGIQGDNDIQQIAILQRKYLHGLLCQKGFHSGLIPLRYIGDDLQSKVGIACHDSRGSGGRNALHAPGIGYDDTFYILDDIAADLNQHPLRLLAQSLSGYGTAICHRNGFRAAHGRQKLLLEDFHKGIITGIRFFHIAACFLPENSKIKIF